MWIGRVAVQTGGDVLMRWMGSGIEEEEILAAGRPSAPRLSPSEKGHLTVLIGMNMTHVVLIRTGLLPIVLDLATRQLCVL
jgi:hypothetical protein